MSFKVSSGLVEGGSTEGLSLDGQHELHNMDSRIDDGLYPNMLTDEERYELDNNRMTIALQEKKILALEEEQADTLAMTKRLREVEGELLRSKEEAQQLRNQNHSQQSKIEDLQRKVRQLQDSIEAQKQKEHQHHCSHNHLKVEQRDQQSKIQTLEATVRQLTLKLKERDDEMNRHGYAHENAQNDNKQMMTTIMEQSQKMIELNVSSFVDFRTFYLYHAANIMFSLFFG